MKKKLLMVGLCGVVCLLVGAVALEAQKSTVASYSDCVSAYLDSRKQMPPLPLPDSAEELLVRAEKGDWSFMADKRWYINQPLTLYVEKDSKLEKSLGRLPAKLVAFEDIRLGEIILCKVDEKEGTWKPIASFKAPALVDETDSDYAKQSSAEKKQELFNELSYRRIIGEITLKPASALTELFKVEEASSLLASGRDVASTMGMMRSSAPPEHTNDIWLNIDNKTLQVFAPDSLTNIEVFACNNLIPGLWTRIATNLNPTGPTNPAAVSVGGSGVGFYRACSWADTDEDGLSSGFEMYVSLTDPLDADSDGDGYSDGPA